MAPSYGLSVFDYWLCYFLVCACSLPIVFHSSHPILGPPLCNECRSGAWRDFWRPWVAGRFSVDAFKCTSYFHEGDEATGSLLKIIRDLHGDLPDDMLILAQSVEEVLSLEMEVCSPQLSCELLKVWVRANSLLGFFFCQYHQHGDKASKGVSISIHPGGSEPSTRWSGVSKTVGSSDRSVYLISTGDFTGTTPLSRPPGSQT